MHYRSDDYPRRFRGPAAEPHELAPPMARTPCAAHLEQARHYLLALQLGLNGSLASGGLRDDHRLALRRLADEAEDALTRAETAMPGAA